MNIVGRVVYKVTTIHVRWLPLSAVQILCGLLQRQAGAVIRTIFADTRDGVSTVHYWEHRMLR